MKLVDTHCHIHQSEFYADGAEDVYARAVAEQVAVICASTNAIASREAIDFAKNHEYAWALVGLHPHDAEQGSATIGEILQEERESIIGIGEIGLDYYYDNSPRPQQIQVFEQQLTWAAQYDLPVSFHVRDTSSKEKGSVWDDFWPIIDNFHGIRGVLHSFTDTRSQLDKGFERGFYVGINGISTFTKDTAQQELYSTVPLDKMLLETDAPYLTPAPYRGRMNEPSFVGRVAEHMAVLRGVSPDFVAAATTANAKVLFNIFNT